MRGLHRRGGLQRIGELSVQLSDEIIQGRSPVAA
jgi:hypothetical protein